MGHTGGEAGECEVGHDKGRGFQGGLRRVVDTRSLSSPASVVLQQDFHRGCVCERYGDQGPQAQHPVVPVQQLQLRGEEFDTTSAVTHHHQTARERERERERERGMERGTERGVEGRRGEREISTSRAGDMSSKQDVLEV